MYKYKHQCDGEIGLDKIHIAKYMLGSNPSKDKVKSKLLSVMQHDWAKPITINENKTLIDGLATLIAFRHLGIQKIPFIMDRTKNSVQSGALFNDVEYNYSDVLASCKKKMKSKSNSSNRSGMSYYERMLHKQHGKCYLCGRKLTLNSNDRTAEYATVDHIMPQALGGSNDENNVALCCHRCNELKGSLMYSNELKLIIRHQREFEDSIGYRPSLRLN